MERNIQRINGIKTDIGKLSDEEIAAEVGYAHNRIEAGVSDLEKLGIESARRFAASEAIGKIIPFPDQGVLFPNDVA